LKLDDNPILLDEVMEHGLPCTLIVNTEVDIKLLNKLFGEFIDIHQSEYISYDMIAHSYKKIK